MVDESGASSVGAEVDGRLRDVGAELREAVDEIKPRLRGWLHAATLPLSLAAGIVLIALAPAGRPRIGAVVFMIASILLFGVSALYHTRSWSDRGRQVLKRMDHSTIFVFIAGTYTPFSLVLLDGRNARILLSIVWGGALVGVLFRVLWVGAPRWFYVPVYLALGWAAIFWMGQFAARGGTTVLTLLIVGGVLYSAGALVYALQRPDPLPRWFGFHELFHSFTIAAFAVHYVGISLATYSLR
ncbi:MAG: hemolysin III family protein [Sporichthyaceae bacterium]|nr:hemolysin III family protein [Sporichthyaceae bacterium]